MLSKYWPALNDASPDFDNVNIRLKGSEKAAINDINRMLMWHARRFWPEGAL